MNSVTGSDAVPFFAAKENNEHMEKKPYSSSSWSDDVESSELADARPHLQEMLF